MAMVTHKIFHEILTIRPWSGLIDLIELWKHPGRIIEVGDQPPAPITEAFYPVKFHPCNSSKFMVTIEN